MRTCQEITEDIEKGNIQKLSVKDKLVIRLHQKICPDCKQYAKDSVILDRLLRHQFKNQKKYKFTSDEKARLRDRLTNH